jgi:hypothetical protein
MTKGTNMKRISIAALALLIGALVLAGCGGSSGSSSGGSSTESSTTASSSGSEAATGEGKGGMFNISEEAKACLKEKGVELPEFKGGEGGPPGAAEGEMPEPGEKPEGGEMPEGGEGGPPGGFGGEQSEEQKKAFEECGVETPEFKGGAGGKPNTNSAAFKKQVNEYVACVRENGYELGEPNFSGEGPVFEKAESESAEFMKASAQCQELLGGPQGSQSG